MPGKKAGKRSRPTKKSSQRIPFQKRSSSTRIPRETRRALLETSRQLQLVLDVTHMSFWEWDIRTDKIKWTGNTSSSYLLPLDSFTNSFDAYLTFIHPDDQGRIREAIKQTLKTKKSYHLEYRFVLPGGEVHWHEVYGNVVLSRKGAPTRLTGTIQDVTARKTTETDLENWKKRHELVATAAGLVIYDYHIPSGDIVWSGTSQEVLGYSPRELGNIDKWVERIHPEDREEAFRQLELVKEKLETYDVYYRFSKKDGQYCHIHDRGTFVVGPDQKAYRMIGMMTDVTERIAAENTIREISQFRESVENAIPDIVYVFDLRTRKLLYANKNLVNQLGYSQQELIEMGSGIVQKIFHPEDISKLWWDWSNEPSGFVREAEYRIRPKTGDYHWISLRTTPFQWNAQGQVTHIIGVAQDITSKKEFATQLNETEQSYRQLFDTVEESLFILDADGSFIDINQGTASMYGYSKHELMSLDNNGLLAAEGMNDFGLLTESLKKAFQGSRQIFEFWGKKKSGEVFLQEVSLTKGSHFGKDVVIAIAWDVTQRRKTEQALRDSEQRFRILQQASFGGIALHDKGRILDCNQGLCDLTGFEHGELVGSNGLDLIAPEWRELVMERIQSAYDKTYDVEGLRKDGSRYMLEIHGKDIPYEGRTIRVTEFRDITERKQAEEKIVEQNARLLALTEDLSRKNNQLEEFTQIVSHNLRSPVGNFTTLIDFLENATTEQERKEYLTLLKGSSVTTLHMLNDLNDVLKIKQDKNIESQQLNFADTLGRVKAMLNAKISLATATIEYDFSEVAGIHYPAIYLESILLNLLDNALKYAHPARSPVITFKTSSNHNGHTILSVRDNGLGLNIARYGHQLFKMRKTFHRHPESRGIGLFMIKNQIEAMGGEITMESQEGEGSVFFVNFNKHQTNANPYPHYRAGR